MKSTVHPPSQAERKSWSHVRPAGALEGAGLPSRTLYAERKGSIYVFHIVAPSLGDMLDWEDCSGLE
jgi:hypothetical protein